MRFLSYITILGVFPLPFMTDDLGVLGCVVFSLLLAATSLRMEMLRSGTRQASSHG